MQTVFIFHGLGGSPQENWFPWLKAELEAKGLRVIVPAFPHAEAPQLQEWLGALRSYEAELQSEPILIGHSLGVPFLLTLLERYKAKSAYLVGGFTGKIHEALDTRISSFSERGFDWTAILNHCPRFELFHGDNDPSVPLEAGRILAERLGGHLTVIPGGGHLNQRAGYTQFPALLEACMAPSV